VPPMVGVRPTTFSTRACFDVLTSGASGQRCGVSLNQIDEVSGRPINDQADQEHRRPVSVRRGVTYHPCIAAGKPSMACSGRWHRAGVWALILAELQTRADAAGLITWEVSVDSTINRAHQHAAGARIDGDLQKEPPGGISEPEPADHALGLSRGGWTTELHLATEQGQKLLSLLVTAGQRSDSPQFEAVLARVQVARIEGDDECHFMITVSETGAGTSEDHLPHVFERFWQPQKSRNRATGGSRLGLAIVRNLGRPSR
jgi:hypothetical protein